MNRFLQLFSPHLNINLAAELVVVYIVQLLFIFLLVRFSIVFNAAGALSALVAVVFIGLPLFVLDRRGKPYKRYGLIFSNPLRNWRWLLAFVLIPYLVIAVFVLLFPEIWHMKNPSWHFVWPENYTAVAFSHFLIVALPEEFFYRGYLLGSLNDIFKKRVSVAGVQLGPGVIIQAALFAFGHFVMDLNPAHLLTFFPALAFAWLSIKHKGISLSVVYHGFCNIFMDLFRAGFGF
jgi:membrane protease YdiL (CAAX protease family)